MSARQSPHRTSRRVEWRVIAVNEKTPEEHAKKLQQVLTGLTDDGFQLVSQMPRGEAIIIQASRFHEVTQAEETAPPHQPGGGKLSN